MASIRVVTRGELIENVPTPGMERLEGESDGTRIIAVRTDPGLVSGWHHHGAYATYGYVISGRLRLESGPGGTSVVEAGPGDFFVVPPDTIHRESNPAEDEQLVVGFRVGSGATVINVEGPDG
ncbi:MAG TPA: cupin domain-containing protein [Candidatus Limnocylindrales bacterium]|nr:cupin domain-containing protein [Candidatus Limnocylindrales bacterium]HEV8697335.1 cupin domain-containing protein [Candidatus Limnocylindrales bacterium]